jgi:phosphohistidine swiveling domain-containing protein
VEKQTNLRIWDATPGYDYIAEVDLPEMHSWFLDGAHCIPPLTPLCGWHWARYCSHGLKVACAELSIPACKGWELRMLHGGIYCAFQIVRDQKEIAEREVKFRQALRPWFEDFNGLWAGYKQELLKIYSKLKELDVNHATNLQLYHHNYDLMQAYMRMWEIHFLGMYASFSAWFLLEGMTKERFGLTDQDPEFQDMMRGFDNKIYQMDKKMWEFGQLAIEMKLEEVFTENEPPSILTKLQQSEKGKAWFGEFMGYLETDDVGGWRMRRFNDFTEPYWLEDLATPIGLVKDNIMRGTSYDLEAIRARTVKKREATIASFLNRVPPEEKNAFEDMLKLAGKVSSYNEEHDLYCELMVQSLMRRGYLAMGRRLVQNGTIDTPEDIFMMNPDEIDRVMMVPESHDMRWITRRRRAAWKEWHKIPHTPVFTDRGSLDESIKMDVIPSGDVIAIKAVVGEMPQPKLELRADLWGTCGCSGEAEGTACVVFTYEDLKKVKPGDILVSPSANPAWVPIYSLVGGIITDTGGTLCHAAIISREYGVPTIVNARYGTTKIKSGQQIRMDATNGAIYILGKTEDAPYSLIP